MNDAWYPDSRRYHPDGTPNYAAAPAVSLRCAQESGWGDMYNDTVLACAEGRGGGWVDRLAAAATKAEPYGVFGTPTVLLGGSVAENGTLVGGRPVDWKNTHLGVCEAYNGSWPWDVPYNIN